MSKLQPDELSFESCGNLTVNEGGEGLKSWCDSISFHRAEVPGGFLYLAVRDNGDNAGGTAMAFVPGRLGRKGRGGLVGTAKK